MAQFNFIPTQVWTASGAGALPTFSNTDDVFPPVGTIYVDPDGKYKAMLCQFLTAADVGDWVAHAAGSSNAIWPYAVTQPGTFTLHDLAGVALGTVAANGYGWLCFFGECDALVDGTADLAIGDALKGVAAADYAVKDVAVGTTPTHKNYGRMRVAYITDATALKAVFVDCQRF